MSAAPRILIVDDDPTNVRFLNEVLSEDYNIKSVSTGEDALNTIDQFQPNIILLDIMLPGLDGYEVCRQIRAEAKYKAIRIVLISAKAMEFEKKKGYEVGGDAYITKPFDHLNLLNKIESMLRNEFEN